jgi:hypothetical protein
MIFETNAEFGAYIKSCACKDLLKLYRENQKMMKIHQTVGAMIDNLEIYPILRNKYNYSRKDLI